MPTTDTTNKDQAKPKKQGVLKYLDNTFGDDGLRTEVKITLTNETAVKIVITAVSATALSAFTYYIIRSMFVKAAVVVQK